MKTNIIKKTLSFIAMAFITTATNNAHAATISWSGATSATWPSNANWSGGTQPSASISTSTGDFAQFSSTTLSRMPNVAGTRGINGMNFSNRDWQLNNTTVGGILSVGANGIAVASQRTVDLNTLIRVNSQSWTTTGSAILNVNQAVTEIAGGPFTLTKAGSGIMNINASFDVGTLSVNGGLLNVNGTAGDVLVNTGGTLGGSGSVQGLTLNGGTVAPGNSPGLLTAYELNGSNGTFQFQLGAPTTRGFTYDAIDVQTLLTLGANTAFTFETLDSYTYGMGDTYDLFNFDSINADAFDSAVLLAALPDLDTANSNLQWSVSNFTTDGIVNVIPEPSTLSLMFGGLTGLIALRMMRRKNG